jgi:hypothetical protein
LANREILRVSWNPNVHFLVHHSQWLLSVLSKIHEIHTSHVSAATNQHETAEELLEAVLSVG